ncbi:MAG TPA: hypothetical protein VM324_12810 [Egibacteraceae bacterium]|nr:hypothetical protein [Egibacteraceae bacterium]
MGVDAPQDLSGEAVRAALPGRASRAFPALLSTEAEARSWARAGAPRGAVVVADYQAAPRGRAGMPWEVRAGEGLGFSLVVRQRLPAEREGWLYTAATCALADVAGKDAAIHWPDVVDRGVAGRRTAAVAVHAALDAAGVEWAVLTVLVEGARPPRAGLLAETVAAIEHRCASASGAVLADYVPRCATLGRTVRARLVPLGPSGPQVTGEAVDCLPDGALVLRTAKGSRVAVRPQHLGVLEDAEAAPGQPQ